MDGVKFHWCFFLAAKNGEILSDQAPEVSARARLKRRSDLMNMEDMVWGPIAENMTRKQQQVTNKVNPTKQPTN